MRPRGFQWFVAWRYLMARPRRLSGIIILFAIVFACAGAAVGYSALLYPLTDEFIAAGEPIPPWLPIGFGAAVAMSVAVFLSATARLVRQIAWPTPDEMAVGRRAQYRVAHVPGRGSYGPAPDRCGRHASSCACRAAGRRSSSRWAAWPRSPSSSSPPRCSAMPTSSTGCPGWPMTRRVWTSWMVLVPVGVFAFLLAFGLTRPRGPRRARIIRLATYLAAVIPVGLAHAFWWRMADFGLVELAGAGIASDYHPPVWLTIVGGVAGAFFTLSLILLGIRYFFTFFTTVSMGGVAIGTMALVITLSVMSGFETDLRSKILGSNAHVLITTNDEAPFPHYRELMEKTARVRGVVAQTPYLTSEVVIAGSSNYFNVVVKGIDPETIARVTNLGQDLDDEQALRRIWPLSEDGNVVGPPPDPPPADLEVGEQPPVDWSGADASRRSRASGRRREAGRPGDRSGAGRSRRRSGSAHRLERRAHRGGARARARSRARARTRRRARAPNRRPRPMARPHADRQGASVARSDRRRGRGAARRDSRRRRGARRR